MSLSHRRELSFSPTVSLRASGEEARSRSGEGEVSSAPWSPIELARRPSAATATRTSLRHRIAGPSLSGFHSRRSVPCPPTCGNRPTRQPDISADLAPLHQHITLASTFGFFHDVLPSGVLFRSFSSPYGKITVPLSSRMSPRVGRDSHGPESVAADGFVWTRARDAHARVR